jgi:hypothetical protein
MQSRHQPSCLQGETEFNTVIIGKFNTPLSSMGRSFRQKINEEPPEFVREAMTEVTPFWMREAL